MHILEYQILNQGVGNSLELLLDQIIDRATTSRELIFGQRLLQVHDAVTLQDMQAFDQLFGLQACGAINAALVVTQFELSLGIRYAMRTIQPNQHRLAMIEVYRLMRGK